MAHSDVIDSRSNELLREICVQLSRVADAIEDQTSYFKERDAENDEVDAADEARQEELRKKSEKLTEELVKRLRRLDDGEDWS